MSRWIEYNPNPQLRRTIDCAVRAVAGALGVGWNTAYILITAMGFDLKSMPSANSTWGSVLHAFGFRRKVIPDTCPDCYTAEDFCRDHPTGTHVLGFDDHTAVAIGGHVYDTFDSTWETLQYYWTKEE